MSDMLSELLIMNRRLTARIAPFEASQEPSCLALSARRNHPRESPDPAALGQKVRPADNEPQLSTPKD
jgi:hypothetical protein